MLPTHRIRIQIVTRKYFLKTIWFWLGVVVLFSLPQASFAYDGRNQMKTAYDRNGDSGVGYDAVAVLATREKKDGTTKDRVPYAKFHKFLAAEGTAARAASGDFYSVAFETELSPTSYPGVSRYMHFKEANTALDAAMNADADFAATMDQLGISVPRSPSGSILGTSPENWVWHHDTEAGIMQLVPKSQHPNIPGGIFWETMHPGGNGGFSIWGQ